MWHGLLGVVGRIIISTPTTVGVTTTVTGEGLDPDIVPGVVQKITPSKLLSTEEKEIVMGRIMNTITNDDITKPQLDWNI